MSERLKLVENGYNKALDDLVDKVKLKYLGVHPDELYEKYYPLEICEQIKELAEQLKEGVEPIKEHNEEVYNKAIDDFVNACKEDMLCQTFGLNINGIRYIAEKLKRGKL